MKKIFVILAVYFAIFGASNASAQSCWYSTNDSPGQRYCHATLHGAQLVQSATVIALAGGNPVPGASSTLGMRIGSIPRISVSGRATGAFTKLPGIERTSATGMDNTLVRSLNLDASVALLSGWAIAPTIGGVGSFDIVASVGKASLPSEFTQSPASWALGARLGVLRESFTMPGVSLTAMYRSIGDIRYGSDPLSGTDATFTLEDNQVASYRAVIGKRLFVLGANAGIGWDHIEGKPRATIRDFTTTAPLGSPREFNTTRQTVFANVTWTMLILNAVLEGGYQKGAGSFDLPLPSGQPSRTQNNTYYGSLALRLAL